MKPRQVTMILMFFIAEAFAQDAKMPLHGTVNIGFVNPQGIVLITDSMLSYNGKSEGFGEKLIRLDENTFVSIAGQYSDYGPMLGDHRFRGAFILLMVVENEIAVLGVDPKASIVRKAVVLGTNVAFALDTLDRMNRQVPKLSARPLSLRWQVMNRAYQS
jgi:20S proteasome alpha/beta subunit